MGSINKILDKIAFSLVENPNDYREVFRTIETTLTETLSPWRARILLYDKKKRSFHTLDKIPVLTSDDFTSFFIRLFNIGKSFIINDSHYFPIGIFGEPLACILLTNDDESAKLPLESVNEVQTLANLIKMFSSTVITMINESNPDEVFRKNKSIIFGEIAGGVLHDLNNIMGAILGRAQLAQMKFKRMNDINDLTESLEVIENIAKSGGKITKRLRNFSKITETLSLMELKLSQILISALDMLEPKIKELHQKDDKKIEIINNVSDDIMVNSDPTALEEIFFNLISNAMDAIQGEGTIEINAYDDNNLIRVSVSDTGCGMSKEVIEKIGTLYYTTKGTSGFGVGISAVQSLLNFHGGVLSYKSEIGKGTTAYFTLPRVAPQMHMIEPVKTEFKYHSLAEGERVLLIEDNTGMKKVMEELLTLFGYEVDSAETGQEGVRMFAENHYDIVFCDIGLPDKSGKDIAKEIREHDSGIPIAAITGWDDAKIDSSLFDITITKPFNIDQIQNFLLRNAPKTIIFENIFKKKAS